MSQKAQRLALMRLPVEDRMGADAGKVRFDDDEHVRNKGRGQQLGA